MHTFKIRSFNHLKNLLNFEAFFTFNDLNGALAISYTISPLLSL